MGAVIGPPPGEAVDAPFKMPMECQCGTLNHYKQT